jgi:hypothetical protein
LTLLSLCPQLADLDVSILNIESATPPSTIALTLYFLESLSILVSAPSIMPHLTLPRLEAYTEGITPRTRHCVTGITSAIML